MGPFTLASLSALAEAGSWDARGCRRDCGDFRGIHYCDVSAVGMPPTDMLRRTLVSPCPQRRSDSFRECPVGQRIPRARREVFGLRRPHLLKMFARSPSSATLGKMAAATLPEGRSSTAGIERSMTALCLGEWPHPMPWITALRLTDGERVVFGRQRAEASAVPVGSAIAASCAIPGYFAPVVIDGERYVDGGVASACNADVLADEDLDAVIISARWLSIRVPAGRRMHFFGGRCGDRSIKRCRR